MIANISFELNLHVIPDRKRRRLVRFLSSRSSSCSSFAEILHAKTLLSCFRLVLASLFNKVINSLTCKRPLSLSLSPLHRDHHRSTVSSVTSCLVQSNFFHSSSLSSLDLHALFCSSPFSLSLSLQIIKHLLGLSSSSLTNFVKVNHKLIN
jgi:hypothetical protein